MVRVELVRAVPVRDRRDAAPDSDDDRFSVGSRGLDHVLAPTNKSLGRSLAVHTLELRSRFRGDPLSVPEQPRRDL